MATIPKSAYSHRIVSNADSFGFELSTANFVCWDSLDRHEYSGPYPDHFYFKNP
jgi:diketogulonate reductase-like aldo/keto reductase